MGQAPEYWTIDPNSMADACSTAHFPGHYGAVDGNRRLRYSSGRD